MRSRVVARGPVARRGIAHRVLARRGAGRLRQLALDAAVDGALATPESGVGQEAYLVDRIAQGG